MAYLVTNPPARQQFRSPRRASPTGCVVIHTFELNPSLRSPDDSAERGAEFIRTRRDAAGSYHDVGDSDSAVQLVRYSDEAFGDGTGSNRFAYHYSFATSARLWPSKPRWWIAGALDVAALRCAVYAAWLKTRTGITIPAKRITRAQSEAGHAGFISHAERDPARRSDPGPAFPWAGFLSRFGAITQEVPIMANVAMPGFVEDAAKKNIVGREPGPWNGPATKAEQAIMLSRTADWIVAQLKTSGGGGGGGGGLSAAQVRAEVKRALKEGTG
jgi:hypothetical protein